jgi:hypothetical protein
MTDISAKTLTNPTCAELDGTFFTTNLNQGKTFYHEEQEGHEGLKTGNVSTTKLH